MIYLQNNKTAVVAAPQSVNSAAVTTTTIDTLGFNYLVVEFSLGAVGSAATVFKLTESDTSGSGYSDISAFTASGSTGNSRLPQTGDANTVIKYFVNLAGRKRYIKPEMTTGTTTLIAIKGELTRANQSPDSNTERGVSAAVFG